MADTIPTIDMSPLRGGSEPVRLHPNEPTMVVTVTQRHGERKALRQGG